MHFEIIKKYLRTVKILFAILLLFGLLDLLFPLPEQKEYSKEILANDGTLLSAYLTTDDKWRLKTELEEVSRGHLGIVNYIRELSVEGRIRPEHFNRDLEKREPGNTVMAYFNELKDELEDH